MNRHLYRVVFNAARGIRMVVQETASSAGKGASRATTVVLGGALVVLVGGTAAQAQIVGAPNVPGHLRPTVITAPNGVPLVNIQTPSAGGVSRNIYNQFNVATPGAILNNSRTNVQSQLGGWVQGNPYLATGPARIILNEVNSGNPSQLRGYIEVAGARAEVIIANPAGISVDGAGFINASRATLTTGTPQLNAIGGLEQFLVRGGTVRIEGAGLDARQTDYAAILARAVEANAGIWAGELKVVAGAGDISADHTNITPAQGTGLAPAFALDVAALGGMYAGKITLVGTEAGLGVRNAGNVRAAPDAPGAPALAGAGQLIVTSAGRLENTGTLQATAAADLQTASLANSGAVSSGGNLKIVTQDTLANTAGGTLAGARLELASSAGDIDNRGGTIRQTSSAALDIAAPRLSNTAGGVIGLEPVAQAPSPGTATGTEPGPGTCTAPTPTPTPEGPAAAGEPITPAPYVPPSPGTLTANSAILNDGGTIYAGGAIDLQSADIDNSGGSLSLARMAVTQPRFSNRGGTLNIANGFSADVDRFDNTEGQLNAGSLAITTTGDFLNIDGTLASASDAKLTLGGDADNTRGTVSATGVLTADIAGAADNTAGTLVANQAVTLAAGSLTNTRGSIQSVQAGVQANVAGHLANGEGGAIGAATDLNLQAGTLANAGNLRAGNDVGVRVNGAMTQAGSLTAGRHATVTAASLDAGSDSVLGAGVQNDGSLGTAGDLRITTTGALAAAGQNLAAGDATLQGASVDLSASQTSAQNIAITATQGNVTTRRASVVTPGTLAITAHNQPAQTLVNDAGTLQAKRLAFDVANLSNREGGRIVQTGTGATRIQTAGAIDNSGGVLASHGDLELAGQSLENSDGVLQAAEGADLSVTVTGRLDNRRGELSAAGTTLSAGSLDNSDGLVAGTQTLDATIQGAALNTRGTLVAGEELALKAGSLANDQGVVQSTAGSAQLDIGAALTNDQGRIIAGTDLDVRAGTLRNGDGGSLRAGNDLGVQVDGAMTHGGQLTAGRDTTVTAASLDAGRNSVLGAGVQSDGRLGAAGELRITTTDALSAKGQNLAAGNATLQGASVDLSDSQTGARNIAITARQGDVATRSASVITPGTLAITANSQPAQTLANDAGRLQANQLQIAVSNLANTQGGQIVQTGTGDTTMAMGGTLNNDDGRIASNGRNLTLQAATLTNNTGRIEHAGGGTLRIAGGRYTGSDGEVTGNGALAVALSGAFAQDRGTTSAKRITIDAGALSNRGGRIVQTGTEATRITIGGALDNNGGTLASNANTTLSAGSLTNQGGVIRAAGTSDLALGVGGLLDNSREGLIGAGGSATVMAGSLDNSAGSLTAARDLRATVGGAATNLGGTLAANGSTTLTAGTLDNSDGTVAAVDGSLQVSTTGITRNDRGNLQAGTQTVLTNGGFSNVAGKATGQRLAIDTRGGMLDNSAKGTIAATTTVDVKSGALNNDTGLVQSGGAMTIDTHGQALINTNAAGHASGKGGIASADTLALTTGAIDNAAGFIGAAKAFTAQTGKVANTHGGIVLGESSVAIDAGANGYDNRGSQTLAKGDLSIAGAEVSNAQGLIRSSANTTVRAARVDNSATSGTEQGIEGQNVAIQADVLSNAQGAIRSAQDVAITSGGTVDNSGGLISAAAALRIQDPKAAAAAGGAGAKTLAIVNTNGTLVGDQLLKLDAARFSGDGTLSAAGDLAIALEGDATNTQALQSGRDLSYSTTGNFSNSAKLLAGRTLNVGANNVDNQAGAEMSGTTTVVKTPGTLTNRGLIDSQGATQIDAGTVNNIGTGRIYGDAISIAAGALVNDVETRDGQTQAATIAARSSLDIGANTILNREHALIFSAGDMFIGGKLDGERFATGQGDTLDNLSADIEALGNMSISMRQVNNWDTHIKLGPQQTTVTGPVTTYAAWLGQSGFYKPEEVIATPGDPNLWKLNPDGSRELLGSNGWGIWYTTLTTTADTAVGADPARIVSGGDMTFDGEVSNRNSQIIAGGTIRGGRVKNESLQGSGKADALAIVFNHRNERQPNVWKPGAYGTVDVGSYKYEEHYNATQARETGVASVGSAALGAAITGSVGVSARPVPTTEVVASVGAIGQVAGAEVTQATGTAGPNGTAAAGAALPPATIGSIDFGPAPAAATEAAPPVPMVVRTRAPDVSIPRASLFRTLPGAGSRYLVETDPRFADYRKWLGSDYLLENLGLNPDNMLKRLGDGFYEQKLIREQVAQLTGYRYLEGFGNDEAQYTALMNSGATFAKAYGLRPGIALTPAQMAQLTSDIVWLVERSVPLADGTTQQVLVPQVYVRVQPGDIDGSGALLSGNRVRIDAKDGDLRNTGTIAGRELVKIDASTIDNLAGRISGGEVDLTAKIDINNLGGTVDARDALKLNAGRDINVRTTTGTGELGNTGIDRVAGLYVSNPGGRLVASAGRDVNLFGAVVANEGKGGYTSITAKNDLNLGTVATSSTAVALGQKVSGHSTTGEELGTAITTDGTTLLRAERDANVRQATIDAGSGYLNLHAERDVKILDGRKETSGAFAAQWQDRGTFSRTNNTLTGEYASSTSVGSRLSGGTVLVDSKNDINIVGSTISGTEGVGVLAGRHLAIVEGRNTSSSKVEFAQEKKGISGLGLAMGLVMPAGKANSTGVEVQSDTAAPSAITSSNGGVLLQGNNNVFLQGVQIDAAKDATIQGGTVVIQAATNEQSYSGTTRSKSPWYDFDSAAVLKDVGKGIKSRESTATDIDTTSLTRTQIRGANVNIKAAGTLAMAGTTLTTPGTLELDAKQLLLATQSTEQTTRVTSQGRDVMYQVARDGGKTDQATNYVEINAGTLAIKADRIQAGLGAQDSIAQLSKQPGFGWMEQLANDPRFKDKVDWKKVEEVHKRWDEDQQGLTPEGAAIVTLVVTYLTWGAASELGVAAGEAAGTAATGGVAALGEGGFIAAGGTTISYAVGGAVSAGIVALASQGAVALINNQGDLGATLKELGSSASVKNLLTAIATGSVLGGLDLNPTGLPTTGGGAQRFLRQLGQNLQAGAARALVYTAINGGSLEESLKTSLKGAILDTIAAQAANEIGGLTKAGKLDDFANKVAHAIAGCVVGAAKADSASGCGAGALGGAVGEWAAELYGKQIDTTQFAALIGGLAVAATGGDAEQINLGSQAGANAAANNYLKHSEASRLQDLKERRFVGRCDSDCETEIQSLEALDQRRDAAVKACLGQSTPACDAINLEVRQAAAEYIRANRFAGGTQTTYADEKGQTLLLAQQTLGGYTVWNIGKGAVESTAEGIKALGEAAYDGFQATVLGDEEAQARFEQAVGASWEYLKDPQNWPGLFGAMSPEQREALARAYETGDGEAVARAMGETLSSLPIAGGAGTIKNVGKLAGKAKDVQELAKRLDVDHVVEVPVGNKGNWDPKINREGTLAPKTAYVLDNGHTYVTDAAGRVNQVEGTLTRDAMDRNDYQQRCVGKCGAAKDEGGHLIAAALGGAGDRINIVPQDSTLNRGDWRAMERDFQNALKEGKTVSVKIDVGYPEGGGVRPNSFFVEATVGGKPWRKEFKQ